MATKKSTKKSAGKAVSAKPAKKAPAKKAPAEKAPAKKVPAKKVAVSKAPAKKLPPKKNAVASKKATRKVAPKVAAKKQVAAQKATTRKASVKPAARSNAKTTPRKAAAPRAQAPAKVAAPRAQTSKPFKFFGLAPAQSSQENSRAVIIPCGYEGTVTYGRGTKEGPAAINEASQNVELFDEELWTEPCQIGIHTHKTINVSNVAIDTKDPFPELYDAVKPVVEFNRFPIIIGGERTISLGAVQACVERYQNLSVLQIGAHSDCRRTFEGNPYTHASVTYYLYKRALKQPRITQVGVRNISAEEVAWMEKDKPDINIYWARHQERWNFQDIVSTLSDNVYLSIDVSGLDMSIMPATGTPEPGGMSWEQITELIKVLCVKKNVVAADIVELAPIAGFTPPDFLCAKLLYKIIGYKFALDLGVTKKYL